MANPTLLTPALIAAVSVTAPTQLQAAPTDSKPTDLKLTESKPTDHSHPSVGKIDGVHAKDLPQDSDVEIKSVKALPDATTALTPATDQTQAAAPAAEADLVQPAQATPPQATPVQATPTQAAQPQTAQTTATVAPVATDEVQSTDKTVSTKPAKEDSLTAVKAITSPDSVGQAQASFQHSSGGGNHSGQSDHSDSKPAELSTAQNQSKNALVTQVVNKFETMMAARPKGGVVIQLNPKDLGSITLTMKTVGKSIDTQISATNADVRAALTGSSADLANSIQSRGYTVSGISVGGEAGSSFQSQTQSQNPNPRSSQPVASPVSGLDPVSQPNVFPLSTSTYKASAGVDLWI